MGELSQGQLNEGQLAGHVTASMVTQSSQVDSKIKFNQCNRIKQLIRSLTKSRRSDNW